jgi:hypothetical protein
MDIAGRESLSGMPWNWKAQDVAASDCVRTFTEEEIAEIESALEILKRHHADIDLIDIRQSHFPLPNLAPVLTRLREELGQGRGFVHLRGLPRERHFPDDMARIFIGLGLYIGTPVIQSHKGEILGSVMDTSDVDPTPGRGYRRGGALNFHADSSDVVGLMCLRGARRGGESRIASAAALHDALLERHPDLLAPLYRGIVLQRADRDAELGSGIKAKRVPTFVREGDRFSANYNNGYSRRAASSGLSTWTDLEERAVTEFEKLAQSPEFHVDMGFQEGDIQFLNNRLILHSRTDYEDSPGLEDRRYLLRLWLMVREWPVQPEVQKMQTDADRKAWLVNRQPHMDWPSAFLASMSTRRKDAPVEGTLPGQSTR